VITIEPRPPVSGRPPELAGPRSITYLRVSVTDRCNLRCTYCMPEEQTFLDKGLLLSFEEITEVARVLVEHGVRKIRITGGEPLMRRDLPVLVGMLKRLPHEPAVVMTTNATLLAKHAAELRSAGLDRLNISLDTLDEGRFRRLAGRAGLQATLDGIEAALAAGFQGTKLNMVVMGGVNDDEIPAMLAYSAQRGLEQRFIEFMPMESNSYGARGQRVPLSEIRARIESVGELVPQPTGSGPASRFELRPGGQRIGLIAAISLPFCETCNRVRLTADGVLRSCLFEGGEVPLRDAMRAADPAGVVRQALEYVRRVKPSVHDGLGHVQMNRVGG